MNVEPQKFFIGLIDFFSILLPGALLTFMLKAADDSILFEIGAYLKKDGPEGMAVFLFSSYVLGHFLFLVGSLLDDLIYDPVRKRTEEKQIEKLLAGRKISPLFIRWLASWFFKHRPDRALNRMVRIKEGYLRKIDAPEAINAFQWCKLRLIKESPETLLIVNRFEANSKFFRSFIPVLLLVAVVSLGFIAASDLPVISMGTLKYGFVLVGAGIFLLLALWRYMEQRFKATQQAYWAVLAMEAQAAHASPPKQPDGETHKMNAEEMATHAGGVVYRQAMDKPVEYLLIQARKNPDHWVLPKGHIEPDEKETYCALREVREETGIWATLVKERTDTAKPSTETEVDLGLTPINVDDEVIRVRFFMMQFLKQGKSKEKRGLKWLPYNKAMQLATHDETKAVLKLAENKRIALKKTEATDDVST